MELQEPLHSRARSMPAVQLAVIFGSTARGKARPSSDLDLGILLDPYSPIGRFETQAELERAAGRTVDLVLLDEAPPFLRFEIARDGVLVFERREGLWTRFKERAMLDWWDWAPYARRLNQAALRRLQEEVARGQT